MEELRVIGNRNRNTCNGNKTNIKKLNKRMYVNLF